MLHYHFKTNIYSVNISNYVSCKNFQKQNLIVIQMSVKKELHLVYYLIFGVRIS